MKAAYAAALGAVRPLSSVPVISPHPADHGRPSKHQAFRFGDVHAL